VNEDELRALIRASVARQLRVSPAPDAAAAAPAAAAIAPAAAARASGAGSVTAAAGHSSHAVYVTLVNAGEACLIEPAVPCSHCNYCKSHGY